MAIEKPTWIYKSKGDKQTASEMNELAQSVIANAIELSNIEELVTNLADDDDLENTIINGVPVIREKTTKTYNPENYSGMGRVVLRKNMVNGVNVLTQEMINQANTIYEIRYDYDLNEQTITIPDNCVLQFEGGSISNGNVSCTYTTLMGNIKINFINFSGTLHNKYVDVMWFGARGDGITDDTVAIQKAIDFCIDTNVKIVTGAAGDYNITKPLNFNTNRGGIKLLYDGISTKWGNTYKGFTIIGNTGTSVIEMIGAYQCSIKGIKIASGTVNPSTIGVVMGRGQIYNGVLHSIFNNVLIDMGSSPNSNNTIGSIGIYMVSNEESSYIDCDIWADAPIILAPTNSVSINPVSTTGVPIQSDDSHPAKQFIYTEFYTDDKLIVNPVSNTVFEFVRGRYISYGNTAPIFTILSSSQVSIRGAFLQRSSVGSSTSGYGYAFELSEYRNSTIDNCTIENARAAIVSRGSLNNTNISISMNAVGNLEVGLLTLIEPSVTYRYIDNSMIKIIDTLTYHSNRGTIPISYIKNINTDTPLFQVVNTTFISNTYSTTLDKNIAWIFKRDSKLSLEDLSTNFLVNSQSINLFKILPPLNNQKFVEIIKGKYTHIPRTGTDFNIKISGMIAISGPSYGSYTNSSISFEIDSIIGIYGNGNIPNTTTKNCNINVKGNKATYFWELISSVDCRLEIDTVNSEFKVFIKAIRDSRTQGELPDIVNQNIKFSGNVLVEYSSTPFPVLLINSDDTPLEELSSVSSTLGFTGTPAYLTREDTISEWRNYDGTLQSKVIIL